MIGSSISSPVLAYIICPALSLEEEVDQMADAMSKINWKEIVQEIFRLPFKLKRQPFKVTFA